MQKFQKEIYRNYRLHGRRFPWRDTTDPYKIMVSEVMLQQTQTARVVEKYKSFLKKFPTVKKLAAAPLSDVLVEWQGLGYNRRGKALHDAAKMIVREYGGRVPRPPEALVKLPGIGPYTAGAIRAFAFNEPSAFIETNIRTVYLHFFFSDRQLSVHDNELLELIEQTCDTKNPRDWYQALMDYGAWLKEQGIKLNSKSRHYTRQSTFEGSDRQIRGAILRELSKGTPLTTQSLIQRAGREPERVKAQLKGLHNEQMIEKEGRRWKLG